MRSVPCQMLLVALCVLAVQGCHSAPMGAGQHELSPDGRYEANATFWYDGTTEWLVLAVKEVGTDTTIWESDEGTRLGVHPPFDQGFGNLDLIQWSEDSREARFAYRVSRVTDVEEWLVVKLSGKGTVVSTEVLPGSAFSVERGVDDGRIAPTDGDAGEAI